MATVIKLLPALAAALLGVFVAFLFYKSPVAGIAIAVILGGIALIGWVAHGAGVAQIRSSPVRSLPLLEAWALVYVALGAIGVAAGIFLAVYLAGQTGDGTDPKDKQLYTAMITAVTAFITGVLVKGLEDLDGLLADRIKGEFQTAYAGCYIPAADQPPGNAYLALWAEDAPGASGWDRKARRARAEVLAANPCPPGAPVS